MLGVHAQEEVGQQYKYAGKMEVLLERMQEPGCGRQLRTELRLLRQSKAGDSQEQRIKALKARIAVASRCHHALQVLLASCLTCCRCSDLSCCVFSMLHCLLIA